MYEYVYVLRNHGWRLGWNHSLAFLNAISSEKRGTPDAYARSEATEHPRGKGQRAGPAGEAPPVYTGPGGGAVLAPAVPTQPSSWAPPPRTRGPEALPEAETLPVYPGRGEEPTVHAF